MGDDRDWLDKTRSLMTLRFGREPTEDDMVAHFMLCGPDQRIRILDTMDAERGEIGDGEDAGADPRGSDGGCCPRGRDRRPGLSSK